MCLSSRSNAVVATEEARMVSEYNATMAAAMGWSTTRSGLNPYEYHPERGVQGCGSHA